MYRGRDHERGGCHGRRMTDRRPGFAQRLDLHLLDGAPHRLSWEDQRAQYSTRLLFCILALMYFNFGGEAQVRSWASLPVVNVVMTIYGMEILFFMWHATRVPHAPWRQRLTMWVDIAAASFAALADSTLSSPGFLVFLMVILGNGMRYGLRLFGEAVIGSLGASILIVWLRLPDYLAIFSVSAIFFLVFFAIVVLYSYSLTAKIERARQKLSHERYVDALTGMLNRRALIERASQLFQSPAAHGGRIEASSGQQGYGQGLHLGGTGRPCKDGIGCAAALVNPPNAAMLGLNLAQVVAGGGQQVAGLAPVDPAHADGLCRKVGNVTGHVSSPPYAGGAAGRL